MSIYKIIRVWKINYFLQEIIKQYLIWINMKVNENNHNEHNAEII